MIKDLEELIQLIKKNNCNINQILSLYEGNDWKNIILNITNNILNGYHKYLFYKNEEFEVYLIIWFPHAKSPIHNHPENGCYLKILEGYLCEDIYCNKDNKIKLINKRYLDNTTVNYRAGNYILHQIQNETNNISTSLHIYFYQNFNLITYNEDS